MRRALKIRFAVAAASIVPLVAAAPARADTGLGPAPGNALNPAGVNPATVGRWMFEEGMGTRSPSARSPTGRLYDIPVDPGPEVEAKPEGWVYSGFMEFGGLVLGGDHRSQGFRAYRDLQEGALLNTFAVTAERPASACYVEAAGGGVDRDDAFYRLRAGRYNAWSLAAFYDGTPQVLTTTYRSLWTGVGTHHLALAGLTPGGTTSAAVTQVNIRNALAATPDSELEVVRKKAGVRLDVNLSESWKAYASFVNERREGARPSGAVFGGGGGGGNLEVAEPVDDQTHELLAGVQYADPVTSFNLRAVASLYRNGLDSFTFENPLFVSLNGSTGLTSTLFSQGRFDLAPSNEHLNVRGEYARTLPPGWRGNFTAVVALGTMRQDEALMAPTDLALTGGTVAAGGASLANVWNTPAALSQGSSQARIDTRLVDLGLSARPVSALDLRGKLRYYETVNSLQYLACNPLTGQWGRLLNDGSGMSLAGASTAAGTNPAGTPANAYDGALCNLAAVRAMNLMPATGNVPIAAVASDYRQLTASLAGDYRLSRGRSLNAALESEGWRRDFRERDEVREDKVKLGYVDRASIEGTVRITYEHARRGGGEYDLGAYADFRSASLGPEPTANGVSTPTWLQGMAQLRSFDLADRRQNVLNARVDYAAHPNLDGAVTVQVKDADFPAHYGRTGRQRSLSATFDVNYQAGSAAVVYGYYSNQAARMAQTGIHASNCQIGETYYFYSDGRVLSAPTGSAAPATPAGATLVTTREVVAGTWREACGVASESSPLFPESRAWEVESHDRNHVLGAGVRVDFGRAKLDASFSRALGRTRIGYAYNAAALGLTAAQVAQAGDGLTDLTFAQSTLSASLLVPFDKTLSMRLLLQRETGRVRDWHYEGLAANPMPVNNAAYLDAGPQDYRATMVGIFFQVRL